MDIQLSFNCHSKMSSSVGPFGNFERISITVFVIEIAIHSTIDLITSTQLQSGAKHVETTLLF